LVESGLGVGLLPYEAAICLADSMGLSIAPLNEEWAERQMLLCFRKGELQSKAIEVFVDHLHAEAKVPQSAFG
jgi:DNA-binding transcriptional LysR family regulator